jgi:hypothetical protein
MVAYALTTHSAAGNLPNISSSIGDHALSCVDKAEKAKRPSEECSATLMNRSYSPLEPGRAAVGRSLGYIWEATGPSSRFSALLLIYKSEKKSSCQ